MFSRGAGVSLSREDPGLLPPVGPRIRFFGWEAGVAVELEPQLEEIDEALVYASRLEKGSEARARYIDRLLDARLAASSSSGARYQAGI